MRRENRERGRLVRRVTAYTNILVSGLLSRPGKQFEILRMALTGEINLAASQSLIDETLDVLVRKFGIQPEDLRETLRL